MGRILPFCGFASCRGHLVPGLANSVFTVSAWVQRPSALRVLSAEGRPLLFELRDLHWLQLNVENSTEVPVQFSERLLLRR